MEDIAFCMTEQVGYRDVVPKLYPRDAPGIVVKRHLDLAPGGLRVLLVGHPRPGHRRQRVRELAHNKP
jgi:hypothetical protein